MQTLIESFKKKCGDPGTVANDPSSMRRRNYLVTRVIEYGNRNGWSSMSLSDAAKIACMERSHFSRVFKRTIGECFSSWRKAQMLFSAIRYLERGYSLNSTIELSGYGDRRSFERVCKSMLNVTPSELAKEVQMEYAHQKGETLLSMGSKVRIIGFPLALFLLVACSMDFVFAAEGANKPVKESTGIELVSFSFSEPVELERMYDLVRKHSIPQVTLFVDLPGPEDWGGRSYFPVRMGYVEGSEEHQRERTRCELTTVMRKDSVSFSSFAGRSGRMLVSDAQIGLIKAEGIPVKVEARSTWAVDGEEFKERVPALMESGKYWILDRAVETSAECLRFQPPPRKDWPPRMTPPRYPPMPNFQYPPALDGENNRRRTTGSLPTGPSRATLSHGAFQMARAATASAAPMFATFFKRLSFACRTKEDCVSLARTFFSVYVLRHSLVASTGKLSTTEIHQ